LVVSKDKKGRKVINREKLMKYLKKKRVHGFSGNISM
jgi:ribosomal protein L34